jgi:2-keto-4-pentenoate hydratase/2-oxohepta-3-ene-1,7-dioic acid hydratase in catechol pathway
VKLVSYRQGDRIGAGILMGSEILDLAAAGKLAGENLDLGSMLAIVRAGDPALAACRRLERQATDARARFAPVLVALAAAQLLAPLPTAVRNIFCVGRNYVEHVREGAAARDVAVKLPEVPQFFTKATHTLIGPGAPVRLDRKVTQKLDYEVELAIIIGRGGRDIAPQAAFEHIFGYTIANDVTARDLQKRHDQWFKGKSLDTTLPLGPCIVPRDDIGDPRALELSLTVNGQERQRALVDKMIFDIPTLIASLAAGLTLESGDIISTGTPSGVGFAMNPPQYLQGGDEVIARIEGIGELRNRIIEV